MILSILILIAGLGVLAYPFISDYLQQKNGSYISDKYDQESAALEKTKREQMLGDAKVYNAKIGGSVFPDPFSDNSATEASKEYRELLRVNGMMGIVEVPKIAVKLPIYHGTSEAALQKGIGHLEGSALPIGGEGNHTVVTGHTGLTNEKMFTNLTSLKVGDEFYFTVLGETLAYQVDQIKVVEPGNTTDLQKIQGEDLATLLTCTPYGVNSHRLLVRGHRVPYDPDKKANTKKVNTLTAEQLLLIKIGGITAAIMLVLILIKVWLNQRQK